MDEGRIELVERRGPRGPRARGPALGGPLAPILSVIAALALSFAVAWPLWALATGARRVYDLLFAAAALAAACLAVVRSRRARARAAGPRKRGGR
jgi:hypothetical protein